MNGQKERILAHLERYGSITQDEAREYYGISRLASRVDELRKTGHPIITERVDGVNRYGEKIHYGRYRMGARG